ncbi:hypothetical protein ACQKI9_29715, partial [Achromobacter xylosoxidans]
MNGLPVFLGNDVFDELRRLAVMRRQHFHRPLDVARQRRLQQLAVFVVDIAFGAVGRRPEQVAAMGLVRTYQIPRSFG